MNRWLLVPGTPVLIPGVAGRSDPAADLRATCVACLTAAFASADGSALASADAGVTVLAAGPARDWAAGTTYDLARLLGGDGPAAPSLPLPLAVGRSLVRAAGWTGPLALRTVADPAEPPPSGLVVAVGDGTLYRHEKGGPGPLDPRAAGFDDHVRDALASGDADALADLDGGLAAELGVTGSVPWRMLGRTARSSDGSGPAGGRVRAQLLYAGDLFGPYAVVADWDLAPAPFRTTPV